VLNTYLQRQLGEAMHFEPASSVLAEREAVLAGRFQLVYANPYSALRYVQQRGFVPVARVHALFDEVVIVQRAGSTLPATGVLRVASATDQLIVHQLGARLLGELGLDAGRIDYHFTGAHPQAAQAVVRGEAELGFVFNETWRGLAAGTREGLQVLAQSQDGTAFHCFCVGPDWAERADDIRQLLLAMNTDPKGQAILADLGFAALEPTNTRDLEPAARLLREAVPA
jgi:phosphonate transport system substrate-binding protein